MTTIATYTRNQLLEAAIKKLGVLARGQTPTSDDFDDASLNLNLLIGYLETKGLFLWKRKSLTITPTAGVSEYNIGESLTLNQAYPLKILHAYSAMTNGNQNIPIDIISEKEYNVLPRNTSSGQPLKLTYQPKINTGTVKIWPVPDSSVATNYTFTIVYQAPFEHPGSGTDQLDFPQEWYLPIVYKLATLLAPEWGVPLEDRKMLFGEAKEYLDQIDSFGIEDASFFISPRKK